MDRLIVIAALLLVSNCQPPPEVVSRLNLLKQVNSSFADLRIELRTTAVLRDMMERVTTLDQFLSLNDQYRRLLDHVINFSGTGLLQSTEQWIYNYRPASLILNDVKIEIRRAFDYLVPLQNKAQSINQQRMNALALPLDQKVKAVNATMVKFEEGFGVLDPISELLGAAIYDFTIFLKDA